jgi:hypothetical protein
MNLQTIAAMLQYQDRSVEELDFTPATLYQSTISCQDDTTVLNLQCRTSMQQYQDKSMEEWRFEAHLQGNPHTRAPSGAKYE